MFYLDGHDNSDGEFIVMSRTLMMISGMDGEHYVVICDISLYFFLLLCGILVCIFSCWMIFIVSLFLIMLDYLYMVFFLGTRTRYADRLPQISVRDYVPSAPHCQP